MATDLDIEAGAYKQNGKMLYTKSHIVLKIGSHADGYYVPHIKLEIDGVEIDITKSRSIVFRSEIGEIPTLDVTFI